MSIYGVVLLVVGGCTVLYCTVPHQPETQGSLAYSSLSSAKRAMSMSFSIGTSADLRSSSSAFLLPKNDKKMLYPICYVLIYCRVCSGYVRGTARICGGCAGGRGQGKGSVSMIGIACARLRFP